MTNRRSERCRISGPVALAAALMLGGCTTGGIGSALSRAGDNEAYTRIELKNPLAIPRPEEVVAIPLSEVRRRYPAFDPTDFSVHLFDTRLYPHGDPLLATDPPPEIAAQLSDRSLDGEPDTMLVLLDFEAEQKQFIAVCSPRFSVRTAPPEPAVNGGLMRRAVVRDDGVALEGEGEFTLSRMEVIPPRHEAGDGLYFLDGVLMETRENAFVLSLDQRLALDVIGKRREGFQLTAMAKTEEVLDRPQQWGGRLLRNTGFGAGCLATVEDDIIVPLGPANSVQYRLISSGPVAAEVEILLNGVRLGKDRFDVKWNILQYAGSSFLVHRARVSGNGHSLAFAMSNEDGRGLNVPSGRSGWMQAMSFGPRNVAASVGGSLGLGILSKGSQCLGHAKALDVQGIRFDPMLRDFSWVTLASWSEQPGGAKTLEEFRSKFEELIRTLNSPVKARNIDFRGGAGPWSSALSDIACEVVLVTGGSKGIGRAVGERLAASGGRLRHLVLSARGASALEDARAACEEAGQGRVKVHALPCDISDPESLNAMFRELRDRCGFVDGLVLNAGIAESAKLHKTTDEMFERIFAVNVQGVFRPMREAVPDMLKKKRGRVVAVASIAAHAGMAYVSAYCASKHAVLGLVRSAAREYATEGITVNAVCPGYVDTPMTQASLAAIQKKTGLEPEQALQRILATNPQKRLFQPEEVAAVIAWLMDESASGVNGASWSVDGGELAG